MKKNKTGQLLDRVAALKSRIVHVVGYFPPHLGGMEVVAREVSRELADAGREVEVITSNTGAKRAPRIERSERYTLRRLRTIEFAHTPFMPTLLWRLLRVKKPAIIHLHLSQAYLPELVWTVCKLRRIPYVVHFHLDVQPSGPLGALFLLYKRFVQPVVMRGATQVIALSPEQATMVKRQYHLSDAVVAYLPNGVSRDFLTIGERPRKLHSPLRLLFVGRLAPQKRVDRLLEALKLSQAQASLHIVGDGEEREKLEKLAKKLELHNVSFTGALRDEALLEEYALADVFVLPSDREGMPLVLFEAMAAGLPVIGSSVQGIREHLAGHGVVVVDPSPETFAKAIDDFYEQREEQFPVLSQASRDKAANYSWPLLTKQLEQLYQKLEQHRRPRWCLGRYSLLLGAIAWWLAFLQLRTMPHLPAYISNAVGFSFLIIVPGMLSVASLRIRSIAPWGRLVLSIGFSLLELMVVGLITNTVLQWFGVRRPLDTPYLIGGMSVLLAVLVVATWCRTRGWQFPLGQKVHALVSGQSGVTLALFPLVFVLLSILGATSLNNGGTDLWTMAMLVGLAGFSLVLVAKSGRLNDTTVASAIFLMSLSLLLMTSLRGWYTTGHDIQLEYQVFELAKRHGIWQIQRFRNPYNACLSITILPTVFANLLKMLDPYIYKVFFQILFATCPVILYLFVRKWLSVALAFLATLYFMSFPTFFTDMPFLNRQEIAFIFFALMLYVIFQDQIKLGLRRALFAIFGFGLVLSHYSTTYSVLVILFLAVVSWSLLVGTVRFAKARHLFKHASSSLGVLHVNSKELRRINLWMVLLLTWLSFMWTVVLTDTGGSTLTTIRQTVVAAAGSFKEDTAKSNDTSYNLFSFSSISPTKEMQEYLQTTVKTTRASAPGLYYPAASYQQYPVKVTSDDVQPLTRLGRYLSSLGLRVAAFNFDFRQASAKLLQILVISGFVFILFRRTYTRLLDSDFIALAAGGVVFVVLQVVLPILSVEYGLLRAFQQSLMLLGLFTVLGSLALFSWLPTQRLRVGAAALLAVLFLLSSTGVLTQAVGGYYAQLNLNNSGTYYDNYYTQKQEIAAISWLNGVATQPHSGQTQLQIDGFTFSRISTYTTLTPIGDIYPGIINKNAYVFLGYANVRDQQATVDYNSDLISYRYPTQFLNQQKNLLYSNGGSEIYR